MSNARCGYQWNAPFIPPPTAPRGYRPVRPMEVCILPENHDGDHRSARNVTAPNRHRKGVSDFDHGFLPLCTFCDAHHRNANQPGGCVVYWQGRADAAEAQVERLRAVVTAAQALRLEEKG